MGVKIDSGGSGNRKKKKISSKFILTNMHACQYYLWYLSWWLVFIKNWLQTSNVNFHEFSSRINFYEEKSYLIKTFYLPQERIVSKKTNLVNNF